MGSTIKELIEQLTEFPLEAVVEASHQVYNDESGYERIESFLVVRGGRDGNSDDVELGV